MFTFHVHDKFYVIHKMNNPKGMVRGEGGFTEGMLFVKKFDQGDATPPPHPPSIRALYIYIYKCVCVCVCIQYMHIKK